MGYVKPQESRSFKAAAEVREGINGPMIVGHGAVFNRRSADMGFIEQVDPDAFTKTLQEADVRGLANHDANWILGRTKAGTMRLRTDAEGLYYEIDVNTQDPDGQRALAKVQRGDWDGSSFSFQTIRDEWNWDTSPPERRLLEVALIDIGPVTFPAYPDATAASRALAPIAEKLGKPVDDLVAALNRGGSEIRSLINGGTTMDTALLAAGEERAVWTTAQINDLPDSAFLYIEDGGDKDSDGKTTPRTLRHFPYKGPDGSVDLPHLRNALARIPQSDLPQSVKDELTAKAQRILAANTDAKSLDDVDTESRVGKKLSAASMDTLQGHYDTLMNVAKGLRDLMDTALTLAPADSDVADAADINERDDNYPSRHLTLVGAELEMRQRVAALEAA